MPIISKKYCPYCHAVVDKDVPLDDFAYVRQSEDTRDKENEKKRERYFRPDNLIASSKYYTKIYQCPCCKRCMNIDLRQIKEHGKLGVKNY